MNSVKIQLAVRDIEIKCISGRDIFYKMEFYLGERIIATYQFKQLWYSKEKDEITSVMDVDILNFDHTVDSKIRKAFKEKIRAVAEIQRRPQKELEEKFIG